MNGCETCDNPPPPYRVRKCRAHHAGVCWKVWRWVPEQHDYVFVRYAPSFEEALS